MSAGSSKVCEAGEELKYDIAVKFDGGDYVRAVMAGIIDGTFKEGDIKTFKVGVDPEPGAVICDPTPEQQTAMDDVYAQIASGDLMPCWARSPAGRLQPDDIPVMTSGLHDHMGGEHSSPPAVELIDITKRFGHIVACDRVNLTLHRGRIHGILGENGAGKSTLMKVLIGLVLPDAGQIRLHGQQVQIVDPIDAGTHGIAMVHQHFSLVEALTVWENVALGDVGRLDPRHVRERVAQISEQYGLDIDPDDRIADLPAGMRQRVEIIKCLRRDPEVLVFDEPTSVLSPSESEFLFDALRRVVHDEGKAVALVSHKLPEILSVTDEVTIMRDGRVVQAGPTAGADASTLARAMVGRDVVLRREHAAFGVVGVDDTAKAAATPGPESPRRFLPPTANERRQCCGWSVSQPLAATVGCCSTDSTSTSIPARSLASPASRTTASERWAMCSRACRTSMPAASRSTVSKWRQVAPVRWRAPALP